MEEIRDIEGVKYKVFKSCCFCSCHSTGEIHISACCNDGLWKL